LWGAAVAGDGVQVRAPSGLFMVIEMRELAKPETGKETAGRVRCPTRHPVLSPRAQRARTILTTPVVFPERQLAK